MTTQYFNPVNYGFKWTEDGWYEFDRQATHKAALKARNAYAKEHGLRKSTLTDQLITRGGIGSGHPEISVIVNVYIAG